MAGMAGPRIEHYSCVTGPEAILRFGPSDGLCVVAIPPPFEEGNRTRAAMVDVLRRLAARGYGGALPDLPGTGESLIPVAQVTISMWRDAFAAACSKLPGPVHVVSWRAGALIDASATVASRWFLSPQSGGGLRRELDRLRQAGGGSDHAGNILSDTMLHELGELEPITAGPLRIVRTESDPAAADRKLPGRPLWRAAEPSTDPELQSLIADDIATWITACAR